MKTALVTTLSDSFLEGFLVSLSSLLESSPGIESDIIIIEWGDLSENSKKIIRKCFKRIIFKSVKKNNYPELEFDSKYRKWEYNCLYRFEIFTLKGYDQIIYFDCDMLFHTSILPLLANKTSFGAVQRPVGQVLQVAADVCFDAGFMVIGEKFLCSSVFFDLLKLSLSEAPFCKQVPSRKWLGNEPLLNNFFLNHIVWLDKKYNLCSDQITSTNDIEHSNIQFLGHNKPWHVNKFDPYIIDSLTKLNGRSYAKIILNKLDRAYNKSLEKARQNLL